MDGFELIGAIADRLTEEWAGAPAREGVAEAPYRRSREGENGATELMLVVIIGGRPRLGVWVVQAGPADTDWRAIGIAMRRSDL